MARTATAATNVIVTARLPTSRKVFLRSMGDVKSQQNSVMMPEIFRPVSRYDEFL